MEDWSFLELKGAIFGAKYVGARDIARQQVWGELDTMKSRRQQRLLMI